jgi:N,N'-diacetyllegionaminate synthase
MDHIKKMNRDNKCLIISEVGSIHDGSLGNSMKFIEMLSEFGSDFIKFQTHIAEAETLKDAPMPPYFKGEARFDYFKRTGFTKDQWIKLKNDCEQHNIGFMSSPFSLEAVELLEEIGTSHYKIASGEVTNTGLLTYIAQTRKPVIISSGMSSWEELDAAINTFLKYHNQITVLQCTSSYPCSYNDVGLNIMLEMKSRYELPVGLSDHTLTPYASYAAVCLGASIIEKHVTFSRRMYGSDAKHSMEPEEFKDLIDGIRAIEKILTSEVDKNEMADKMSNMKRIFEKSIVSITEIPKGTPISREMIGVKKPGTGIPPTRIQSIIGKKAVNYITKDSIIQENDIE